ncbi:hypothetical protein ACHAXS_006044, partial [Conticribra weissflogii]
MFCYFQISIAGGPPRRVVFQLHSDKAPKTCDNFIALCRSPSTAKRPSKTPDPISNNQSTSTPTYRGTEFHRIIPNFMIQGGDFTNFDGTGGHAFDGGTFPDEIFEISHDREGILSMANRGKNTNGSQFFITLGKALHLDGKHVAFGRVTRGMEVLREASRVETDEKGRPGVMQRVVIVDCGLGTGQENEGKSSSSGSHSSSTYSLEERKRKRRSGSKRKSKHRQKHGDEDDSDYDSRKEKRRKSHGKKSRHSKHRKQRDKDKK